MEMDTTSQESKTSKRQLKQRPNRSQMDLQSERTVYYCSEFDLDASKWFSDYEMNDVFKTSIIKKLGKYSNWEPILAPYLSLST